MKVLSCKECDKLSLEVAIAKKQIVSLQQRELRLLAEINRALKKQVMSTQHQLDKLKSYSDQASTQIPSPSQESLLTQSNQSTIVPAISRDPVKLLNLPMNKSVEDTISQDSKTQESDKLSTTLCQACGKPGCKPWDHAGWHPEDPSLP